ncbi:T4SS effector SidA family protein [Legionella bozemanae]|nr:T4SS effector SidA family protein [Legionella bozemanae]
MDDLKRRINERKKEQKSLIEIAHKKGKLSQRLLEGTQKILGLIGAIFTSSKELPVIGFVFQMLSAIPNAITTLTDKKSSIGSKIFAIGILLTATALGITAFVLGGIVAAGIGLAFASLTTLIEGISLIGALVNKYQTSKAYKEKKEFIDLLKKQDIALLTNDKYREQLAIRALELEHLLEKSTAQSFIDELEFIKTISSNIASSDFPDDSPVSKLSKLYNDRKDLISYLGIITQLIDQKDKEDTSTLIKLVSELQHQIAEIDEDIENITGPLHHLQRNNLLANEAIAKSYANFALGGAGVILSTIGLMILLSTIAAPPIMGPILLGFGIGLAIFGVVKWGIELYATREDEKTMLERANENEEIILEEALKCSYSNAMRPILDSKGTTPEEPKNSKNKTGDLAITSEPSNIESTPPLNSSDVSQKSGEFQI